ncbi:MAG: fibronectin type III domain-containing protein [Paludibacteraceae bacterium]|nr:fibronectin type III domain-containing protein [Paludibacteraceae bacterium]
MKRFLSILTLVCLTACFSAVFADCKYRLIMADAYGDGWNGGKLTLTDDGGSQEFELTSAAGKTPDTVLVTYGGGNITGTWTSGSWGDEVSFKIITDHEAVLFEHVQGDEEFPDFTITMDPCGKIGNVPVTLLIPSDNGFDVNQDMYFIWTGTVDDLTEHKVKLTREGTTRFWKATVDIQDYGYTYLFKTDDYKNALNQDEHTIIEGSTTPLVMNTPVCAEAGPVHTTAEISGVQEIVRYNYALDCDLKDHNYNVDSLTAKATATPGQVKFNWLPYETAAYQYRLVITYYGGSWDTELVNEVPYIKKYSNDAEIKIAEWTVQPLKSDAPYEVGELFVKNELDTVRIAPSPFFIKNVVAAQVEGTNTYTLSWDVIPEAGEFSVSVSDPYGVDVLTGEFKPEDLTVKDGKYVLTTAPMTASGYAYYYISVKDKDGEYRSSVNSNFEVAAGSLAHLGTVNVAVFIPSDACGFDPSKGVTFRWYNGTRTDTVAATQEGRWFKAELNVDTISFHLEVANDTKANYATATKASAYSLTDKDARFYVAKSYGYWYLYRAEGELTDHDWRVQDVDVTPDDAKGTFDVAVNTVNRAASYGLYVYDYSYSTSTSYRAFYFTPETGDGAFTQTIESYFTNWAVHVDSVVLYAYDEADNLICSGLGKKTDFTIPLRPMAPRNLKATQVGNSIKLEWDAAEGVSRYYVYADLNYSTTIAEWDIDVSKQAPVGGKYTVTLDKLYGNGTYTFYVQTYVDGSYIAEPFTSIVISGAPALGDVTLRVLIPSDNNFPTTDLPHFFVIPLSGSDTTDVVATKNSRWYEATFNWPGGSYYFFMANKAKANLASAVITYSTDLSNANSACFEMKYNDSPSYDPWQLLEAECTAADHDYRVTKVTITNTQPSSATITVEAPDIAPRYYVQWRTHGTTDSYNGFIEWTDGSASYTFVIPFDKDTVIDVTVYPYDENWNMIADPYEDKTTGFQLNANTTIPKDLVATIAEDGQTVDFSWTCGGTVAAYAIEVYNYYYDEIVYQNLHITGTTASAKFTIPDRYSWLVAALDANNQVIGYTWCSSYFRINTPDLRPTNLNANVATKTVTLTADVPETVTKCKYLITDYYSGDTIVLAVVPVTDGKFIAQYTQTKNKGDDFRWRIVSMAEDGVTEISYWANGSYFYIDGKQPDPTPATHATLTVSAGEGGSVNSNVNGTYKKGTTITLKATADDNWYFEKWSDGVTGTPRDLVLTQDTTIQAIFKSNIKYKVQISAGAHGKVTSSLEDGVYKGGTELHITAKANDGYKFTKWSDGNKKAVRDITITEDVVLKAQFAEIEQFKLTVEITPAEGGTVLFDGAKREDNTKTVDEETNIKLTANAADGYEFDHFKDGTKEITTAEYTITMTENKTVQAVFKKKSQAIDDTNAENKATKFIRDNQMYIRRNGVVYTLTGARVE